MSVGIFDELLLLAVRNGACDIVIQFIEAKDGIVLLCGATGSGKEHHDGLSSESLNQSAEKCGQS